MTGSKRIVVVGGGFGGAYAAQELCKKLDTDRHEVILIDQHNYLVFYPLLVEAGVGTIEPRHVVVPLRSFLDGGQFRAASVVSIDLPEQQITLRPVGLAEETKLRYDHLVFALGSTTKFPPIPGLQEHGFDMKSLADAIGLRDRGIQMLELANVTEDPVERQRLLTFVVVGAGYSGVEFASEYQAFLQDASETYEKVKPEEIRVYLLEYSDKILSVVPPPLSDYTTKTLRKRGIEIQTGTTLKVVEEDHTITSKEERIETRTVVWTAGIAPNPLIKATGFPVNERGYIQCRPTAQVEGYENVWAVGDSATILGEDGKPFAPTAQNASREGTHCAKNIAAAIQGRLLRPFRYRPMGAFAAIGRHHAVAQVMNFHFTGFFAWFLYRTVYLMKMPTLSLKMRLIMDWTVDLFFRSNPVQLGVHRLPHPAEKKVEEPAPRAQAL